MLITSSTGHQTNLFGIDLLQQLDPNDPLLRLATVIPWHELDQAFTKHYCQGLGRPAKPIRLMVGLLILKPCLSGCRTHLLEIVVRYLPA